MLTANYTGISCAPGIALGVARALAPADDLAVTTAQYHQDTALELQNFRRALSAAKNEFESLSRKLAGQLNHEILSLFDAYCHLLANDSLGQEVEAEIKQGLSASTALKEVIQRYLVAFEQVADPYFQERANDLRDLARRILAHLHDKTDEIDYPQNTILIGQQITPAQFANIATENIAGIITQLGSETAHIAILAKAMNIPMVTNITEQALKALVNEEIILDAEQSLIFVKPDKTTQQRYQQLLIKKPTPAANEPLAESTCTQDNRIIHLYANLSPAYISKPLNKQAFAGIGLYRTEDFFMQQKKFPSEADQIQHYQKILSCYKQQSVTLRCLDIGGDKALPYFPIAESNSALGWRGVRVLLDKPDIFSMQIRAMLAANYQLNNLSISLPMVSHFSELMRCLKLIKQAYADVLTKNNWQTDELPMPDIGMMVEVPAIIYQLPSLLEHVQFISVGSNDLIQYLLAADRNNAQVAHYYNHFHPAVLKALHTIAAIAQAKNKPAYICGEMASDTKAAALLVALGFTHLSIEPSHASKIHKAISQINYQHMQAILPELLTLETAEAVKQLIQAPGG